MPTSKHRPAHKAKKKESNIKKQNQREAMNDLKDKMANMPINYTYHKDAEYVKVPMRAWQMLNALAKELQPLAMLVSTFEQLGQEHIHDGTLIPVFKEDVEPEMKDGAPLLIGGQPQLKIKEVFWNKHTLIPSAPKPTGLVTTEGEELTSESPVVKLQA